MYSEVTIPVYSDESDITYQMEYHIVWAYDGDYGADADGRRGEPRCFVDDVQYMGAEPPLLAVDKDLPARYEDFAREKALEQGPEGPDR